jgi:Ca2+-binding EF-hand superfamily protein
MLLRLYRSFLHLFPARYRCTFGLEMSAVFQQAQADAWSRGALYKAIFCIREFTDLIPAAFRERGHALKQWAMRPKFSEQPTGSGPAFDAVPAFYTCASYSPRRSALIHGGILSLAMFSAICFALGHSGSDLRLPSLLIGSYRPHPHWLEARTPATSSTDLDTEVKVKPVRGRPKDVWSKMLSLLESTLVLSQSQQAGTVPEAIAGPQGGALAARFLIKMQPNMAPASAPQGEESEDAGQDDLTGGFPSIYFRVIRVLGVLDADHDGVISAAEIANAPAALRSLDRNHDGKLSPSECGQTFADSLAEGARIEAKLDPQFLKLARLGFMRSHPVLAALDADHNGEISASEIQNATAALKGLDKNGDGRLTQDEILPDPVAFAVAVIMRLDENGDGQISKDERSSELAGRYRDFLDAADQNKDGVVTEEEVTNELRRRAVLTGTASR